VRPDSELAIDAGTLCSHGRVPQVTVEGAGIIGRGPVVCRRPPAWRASAARNIGHRWSCRLSLAATWPSSFRTRAPGRSTRVKAAPSLTNLAAPATSICFPRALPRRRPLARGGPLRAGTSGSTSSAADSSWSQSRNRTSSWWRPAPYGRSHVPVESPLNRFSQRTGAVPFENAKRRISSRKKTHPDVEKTKPAALCHDVSEPHPPRSAFLRPSSKRPAVRGAPLLTHGQRGGAISPDRRDAAGADNDVRAAGLTARSRRGALAISSSRPAAFIDAVGE